MNTNLITDLKQSVQAKYEQGGITELIQATKRQVALWTQRPPLWMRLGRLSRFLALKASPVSPPVLLIAYPRSGSTWVGTTLGQAANAMYLNEPMNHNYERIYPANTFLDPDDDHKAGVIWYRELLRNSFEAFPNFPVNPFVISYPEQWPLRERRRRRLVIKEVNLLGLGYIVPRYHPRVILLLRHPAGIATSFFKKGWIKKIDDNTGRTIGRALRAALNSLETYNEVTIVFYEKLCLDPIGEFSRLVDFSSLHWDEELERIINKRSFNPGTKGDVLTRESKSMIWSWKETINQEELDLLRSGYLEYALPWYRSDDVWSLDDSTQTLSMLLETDGIWSGD